MTTLPPPLPEPEELDDELDTEAQGQDDEIDYDAWEQAGDYALRELRWANPSLCR